MTVSACVVIIDPIPFNMEEVSIKNQNDAQV